MHSSHEETRRLISYVTIIIIGLRQAFRSGTVAPTHKNGKDRVTSVRVQGSWELAHQRTGEGIVIEGFCRIEGAAGGLLKTGGRQRRGETRTWTNQ